MKLRLTKLAREDLEAAAAWYESRRPWLAEQFVLAIAELLEQILRDPNGFPLVEVPVANTKRQWRRAIQKRFSYVLVYFISAEAVVIVSITHTSRDWTSRLTDTET